MTYPQGNYLLKILDFEPLHGLTLLGWNLVPQMPLILCTCSMQPFYLCLTNWTTHGTLFYLRTLVELALLWRHVSAIASVKNCGMFNKNNYNDVRMGVVASKITGLTIVYSTVYSGADQRKHLCSATLAFVRGIHRWPVNSPHKGP